MKLKRVSRLFLAFLLATGVQLSLTTCTRSGEMISAEETMDNEKVYKANSEIDNNEELSSSHVRSM